MARTYRFSPALLRGQPGDINEAVKRVIVRATNAPLIVISTTGGKHTATSYHYRGMAVDLGTPDGSMGAKIRFQRWCAARPHYFLEVFGPDNVHNIKNGQLITLAEGSALEELHDTHTHVAPDPARPLPRIFPPRPPLSDRVLGGLLAARWRVRYARKIVAASRATGLPLPLGLALIQQETNFRNVFGHDPTIFAGAGYVTSGKYAQYKFMRDRIPSRREMQGVGPAQLTWWEFQDAADRMGGCWKPHLNIIVGFRVLKGHIDAEGLVVGVARYNGTGPDADRYSKEVREKAQVWADRIKVLRRR